MMNNCEELLMYLANYGKPRLSMHNDWKTGEDNWYCVLELTETIKGCKGEIKSEWSHRYPFDALYCVYERLKGLQSLDSSNFKKEKPKKEGLLLKVFNIK